MEIRNNVRVETTAYVISQDGVIMTATEWLDMVTAERSI